MHKWNKCTNGSNAQMEQMYKYLLPSFSCTLYSVHIVHIDLNAYVNAYGQNPLLALNTIRAHNNRQEGFLLCLHHDIYLLESLIASHFRLYNIAAVYAISLYQYVHTQNIGPLWVVRSVYKCPGSLSTNVQRICLKMSREFVYKCPGSLPTNVQGVCLQMSWKSVYKYPGSLATISRESVYKFPASLSTSVQGVSLPMSSESV